MNNEIPEVEVVIVGAGAAGLAAGRELSRAGKSFLILEARDRMGGRAWTDSSCGYPIDLGAGWLHSADKNPFVGIANELGVDIERSTAPWQRPAWSGNFPLAEQKDYRDAWARLYERLEAGANADQDRPASDFLEPGNSWNPLLDAGSTFVNGVEFSGLSTIDYDRYEDNGVNWRAPTGFGALIARMGAGLPVHLNCRVTLIDHSGQPIRVHTPRGEITARAVIVTVSTNLIAREHIRFQPAIPDKFEAAANLPLGLADKLFLAVDDVDDLPIDGRLYGSRDKVGIASYHTRPFGRPLIECYFGGAFARALEADGEAAFANFAIEEICSALGSGMRDRLNPVTCSRWGVDPFSLGSYSHARIGQSDARAILAAPIDNRIYFAGEATSRHDYSTAHGAFRSGVAAAKNLIGRE